MSTASEHAIEELALAIDLYYDEDMEEFYSLSYSEE